MLPGVVSRISRHLGKEQLSAGRLKKEVYEASPAKAKVRLHLVLRGWECLRPPNDASKARLRRGDKIISQIFFPFVTLSVIPWLNS